MRGIPSEVLLNWPKPNYINPQTNARPLKVLSPLLLGIATLCVGIRLYGRIFVRRWIGADDVLVFISWLCAVGVSICIWLASERYDMGKHVWDMQFANLKPLSKALVASTIFWMLGSLGVRLSILCLYYRLLRQCQFTNKRHYLWSLHIVTAATLGLMAVYSCTFASPCNSLRALNLNVEDISKKACNELAMLWKIASVVNTFLEFVVALIPMFAVYSFGVDSKQRWRVISLLSLGFFVTVAGGFRTYYIFKTIDTYDFTWWVVPQWVCSEIEVDLALICACAAPVRPLAGRLILRMRQLSSNLFGQASTSISSKDCKSQSPGVTTFAGDSEGVHPDGESMRQFLIDIEGIGIEDGCGYTVTISGPPPARRSILGLMKCRRRSSKQNDTEKGQQIANTDSHDYSSQKIHVEAVKTLDIDEEYRDVNACLRPRTLTQLSSEGKELEIETASQNLNAWGLLNKSEPGKESTRWSKTEERVELPSTLEPQAEYPPAVVLEK